jgi:hypothetical protein
MHNITKDCENSKTSQRHHLIDEGAVNNYLDSVAGLIKEARQSDNAAVVSVVLGVLQLQDKTQRELFAEE